MHARWGGCPPENPRQVDKEEQNQLHRELDRTREGGNDEGSTATAEWAPPVDIKEEPDKIVSQADLPGVTPEAT